jgi:hypothetical protein
MIVQGKQMRKPTVFILILILTASIFSAGLSRDKIVEKIKSYKKELVSFVKETTTSDTRKLLTLVQKIKSLIAKIETDSSCNKYCVEIILYAKQTLAGIYIHRLSKPLEAIKNYDIIIKHPYFKKHANPLIKWLIYEGAGIAYKQRNNFSFAKKHFVLSLKEAQTFKKANKKKGSLCIQSTAYNLAVLFARDKNAAKTLKMLELAFKNCLNISQKKNIVLNIKKNNIFLFLNNNTDFNRLIKL